MNIKELVRRSKKGDKEAFVALMDQHRQMLYNTGWLLLRNEDDVLDAIQDTILTCWSKLPMLKEEKYFKTWMTKILMNKCYDILRGKSRCYASDSLPEAGTEEDLDTPMDVTAVMKRLQHDDHLILSLFYYDDFSIQQISEMLNLSQGAVKTRLSRSRDKFKKIYVQGKGELL